MTSKQGIAIIGVGRLGGALALALARKNYVVRQLVSDGTGGSEIAALISPPPEIISAAELGKISAEIIFITTPDAEIRKVADDLASQLNYQPFVFHTSGALSSEILQSLKNVGCPAGSLHPLVAVSDPVAGAASFRNVFFCVEGARRAVAVAENIVADLDGKAFSIPTEFKTLYHAAAVTASGHLVALFSVAVEMLAACGLSEIEARKILLPLVESTIKNLSVQSPPAALTGTFARADVETLVRHLTTLRANVAPLILEIYLQLGRQSLHLAEEQGADAAKLAAMLENLTAAETTKIES